MCQLAIAVGGTPAAWASEPAETIATILDLLDEQDRNARRR
jgi:hypothetical protein